MSTINELKREFLASNRQSDDWIEYCRSQKALGDQAFAAAVARDGRGKKHPHQFRLSNSTLETVGSILRENVNELKRCKDFDAILRFVETNKVVGFGQLAIYDTALRIGHCMEKLPQIVYLHAGTRKGAKFHKIKHANEDYILPDELPAELRDLAPHDVEDFLCLYKDGQLRFDDGCSRPSRKRKGPICPPEPKPKRNPIR
jgi:hypothetical protein